MPKARREVGVFEQAQIVGVLIHGARREAVGTRPRHQLAARTASLSMRVDHLTACPIVGAPNHRFPCSAFRQLAKQGLALRPISLLNARSVRCTVPTQPRSPRHGQKECHADPSPTSLA